MKITSLLLSFTLLLSATDSMELVYLKNACNACHGTYGEGMGSNPRLQGVKEKVLLSRLKNLQAGKTRLDYGAVMISFAKSLDENQTKQMAHYLSHLKTTISEDRYDEEYDPAGDGGS
jgi:cytochrome c553